MGKRSVRIGSGEGMKESIIIDVRTREEFVKEHIKGSINIPLHDMEFYMDFLREKDVYLYCDTARRAEMAAKILEKEGIETKIIKGEELKDYEKEGKNIICAVNYVFVRNGMEDEFEEMVESLCKITDEMPGFLGGKLLKMSGISAIGSGLPGDLKEENMRPTKYIMLTYWKSKEAHEKSHLTDAFKDAFQKMPAYLTQMPYEEFYEILR